MRPATRLFEDVYFTLTFIYVEEIDNVNRGLYNVEVGDNVAYIRITLKTFITRKRFI